MFFDSILDVNELVKACYDLNGSTRYMLGWKDILEVDYVAKLGFLECLSIDIRCVSGFGCNSKPFAYLSTVANPSSFLLVSFCA